MDQKLTLIRLRSRPLYLEAIEASHDLLERGVFRPRDALPPEDVLAKQLGIPLNGY